MCRFSLNWRAVRRGVFCNAVMLEEAILTAAAEQRSRRRKRVVFSYISKT